MTGASRSWIKGRAVALLALSAMLVMGACERGAMPWEEATGATAPAVADSTLALAAPAVRGGAVHLVRLVADGDAYRFEPAEVRVRPGDVVRFVQTGRQPESVAFLMDSVPAAAAQALYLEGAHAGPLLVEPGAVWDIHFNDLPPGSYPFVSVPHVGFGMRGRVVVEGRMENEE